MYLSIPYTYIYTPSHIVHANIPIHDYILLHQYIYSRLQTSTPIHALHSFTFFCVHIRLIHFYILLPYITINIYIFLRLYFYTLLRISISINL